MQKIEIYVGVNSGWTQALPSLPFVHPTYFELARNWGKGGF